MTLRFDRGYRMLAWFSTVNAGRPEIGKAYAEIRRLMEDEFKETLIRDPFFGISFGRYDFVLDFFCDSGKVASHFVSEVANAFEAIEISTAYSCFLCKPIINERTLEAVDRESKVRCYAYLRPRLLTPIEWVSQEVHQNLVESPDLAKQVDLLWNDSAYPLVLVVQGKIASEALITTRELRGRLCKHLSESSTSIALQYGRGEDQKGGLLEAICFIKLANPCREIIAKLPSGTSSVTRKNFAPECLGWYDNCRRFSANSLWEMQDQIFSMKEGENKELIYQTSTILLYEPDQSGGTESDGE